MKKRSAQRKSVPSFVMFATILVAITIPLVVMGLSSEGTFDIRNRAYEIESPTTINPCIIYFPKVNPATLEVNGNYKVSVEAISSVKDIEGITIVNTEGETLFEKEFTSLVNSVEETFTYSPSQTGAGTISGSLRKVAGDEICLNSLVTVINENRAPEITSEEKDADISVGDEFEYTIIAEDSDGDILNFAYSFTPRADWLKKVVIEDGSNGAIKIKLQGTPDKPASYLAHIFVHDGYGNHLNSMSWIINVNQSENDIPIVKILNPSETIVTAIGTEIYTKWLANDQNQIVKYQIYIAQDPTDSNTWEVINQNISHRIREYSVNTTGLTEGIYRLIVRATDNQNPEGIGLAVSPEITLIGEEKKEISDNIVLVKPQIINITPNNSSKVENPKPIMRATLIAGTDATIDEESISFSINNIEVKEGIRLNRISDKEITFIYQPEENLNAGIQKLILSFKDTNDNVVEKEWTFTFIDTTFVADPDIFIIFGVEINKKIVLIIGAGIVVVLLAILVPIIIYKMWSKDDSKIINKELPPKIPSSKTMYELKSNINVPPQKKKSNQNENIKTGSRFSTLSSKALKVKENTEKTPTLQQVPIEKTTKETISHKESWRPKIVTPTPKSPVNTIPAKTKVAITPKESQNTKQPLPNLAIPTPETFKQPTTPQPNKTMDDISQLYKEIQKVENQTNTDQPQNS